MTRRPSFSRRAVVDTDGVFWLPDEASLEPRPAPVPDRAEPEQDSKRPLPAGQNPMKAKADSAGETYDISLWTEAADVRWDTFVASHPLGQGAATSAARQLWMAHGWAIQWLVALRQGTLAAGLMLGVKYSRLSRSPLVRVEAILPDVANIVDSSMALLMKAESVARSCGALGLQTTCRIYDAFPIHGVDYAAGIQQALQDRGFEVSGRRKGTYILDVQRDDKSLLESVSAKCRRDILKGQREGVKIVNLEGWDKLQFLGEMHAKMGRRRNRAGRGAADPLRLEYLAEPYRRGFLRLFGAEYNGEIVNMALVDVLGVARWRVGATADAALGKGVPPTGQALQYAIMQWLRDHQVRYYDLGGVPGPVPTEKHGNYGAWRFKHEFGGAYVETMPQYLKSLKTYGGLAVRAAQLARRMFGRSSFGERPAPDSDAEFLPQGIATSHQPPRTAAPAAGAQEGPAAAPPAPTVMRLVNLESAPDRDLWDAFVSSHSLGTAMVLIQSQAFWEASKWRPLFLAAWEGDRIVAAVALATKKISRSPWTVTRVNAILPDPRDPYGSAEALLKTAEDAARHAGSLAVQVRCSIPEGFCVGESDVYAEILEMLRQSNYVAGHADTTYLVDIARDDEALLGSFSKNCRHNVRSALRKGVSVTNTQSGEPLEVFFESHTQMSVRKGLRPLTPPQFDALRTLCSHGSMRAFVAHYNGDICNIMLVDTLGVPRERWAAVTEAGVQPGVPVTIQVLRFEIMKWLRDRGQRCYDLGGSPGPEPVKDHPNYSVWRLKHEFGGRFVSFLPWHYRPLGPHGKFLLGVARRLGYDVS